MSHVCGLSHERAQEQILQGKGQSRMAAPAPAPSTGQLVASAPERSSAGGDRTLLRPLHPPASWPFPAVLPSARGELFSCHEPFLQSS